MENRVIGAFCSGLAAQTGENDARSTRYCKVGHHVANCNLSDQCPWELIAPSMSWNVLGHIWRCALHRSAAPLPFAAVSLAQAATFDARGNKPGWHLENDDAAIVFPRSELRRNGACTTT